MVRYICVLFTLLAANIIVSAQESFTLKNRNICVGDQYNLNDLIETRPVTMEGYTRWKQGNTYIGEVNNLNHLVSPATTTAYTLEYTLTAGGTPYTASATITVWTTPTIQLPKDTTVCRGQTIKLNATITNATIELWRNTNGSTYSTGDVVPITSAFNSFVLTARNDFCANGEKTATWTVRSEAPITAIEARMNSNMYLCARSVVSLNSYISYLANDRDGVSHPASYTSGSINWTGKGVIGNSYIVPIDNDIPVTGIPVLLNASYTSVCDGQKTYQVTNTVSSNIYAVSSSLNYSANYVSCPDDDIRISLSISNTEGCDTIEKVDFFYNNNTVSCRLTSSTVEKTSRTYHCPPISSNSVYNLVIKTVTLEPTTVSVSPPPIEPPWVNYGQMTLCLGDSTENLYVYSDLCDDISSVKWESNNPNAPVPTPMGTCTAHSCRYKLTGTASATYTAEITYRRRGSTVDSIIRRGYDVYIPPSTRPALDVNSTLCRGERSRIRINAVCDTIKSVTFSGLNSQMTLVENESTTSYWVYEGPFKSSETFTATITYRARMAKQDSVYTTPQKIVTIYDERPTYNLHWPVEHNKILCRGDSLLVTIYSPSPDPSATISDPYTYSACDTLKSVTWRNANNLTLPLSPPPRPNESYNSINRHAWQFYVAPTEATTYLVEVEYMSAAEQYPRERTLRIPVEVSERPSFLVAPSVGVCKGVNPTINLNDYIDSKFVNPNDYHWIGVPTPESYPLTYTSNFIFLSVQGVYKYTCSELPPGATFTEQLRIVLQQLEDPIIGAPNNGRDYCKNSIPLTIFSPDIFGTTTYTWTLGDSSPIEIKSTASAHTYTGATATNAGTLSISVVLENSCGVSDSRGVTINLIEPPMLLFDSTNITICNGKELVLDPVDWQGELIWSNLPSPPSTTITAVNSATYTVMAVNVPCPNVYDTVRVNVQHLAHVSTTVPRIVVCQNDEVNLPEYIDYNNYNGDQLYWIKFSANTYIPVPETNLPITSSDTYTAVTNNSCNNDSSSLYIEMIHLPVLETVPDTMVCYGDVIALSKTVKTSTEGELTFTLHGEQIDDMVTVTGTETYTLVLTTNLCGVSDPCTVIIGPYPIIELLPTVLPAFSERNYYDIVFQLPNSTPPVVFEITGDLPAGLKFQYAPPYWGSIIGFSQLTGHDYHEYPITIRATDYNECTIEREYVMRPKWNAPNAFIPGGSNDANNHFLGGFKLEIYDRQGQLIQYDDNGWNGTDRSGRIVPSGTYFYKVIIQNNGNPVRYESGFITVLPPK